MARKSKPLSHIKDLVPDPKNRRSHNARNIGMVVDALQQVGAARSIVIDEDGVILAGNGVTEAAAEAGITKVRVVQASGDELVAVQRVGLTEDQKRALAIYDNRTAELAAWNFEQLAQDKADGLGLQPFWTPDEEVALLAKAEAVAGYTDPDDVPEERATDIKLGDVFCLGKHRLMCGDSTSGEAVQRLLDGAKPFLMVTDPPYGVDYDPTWRDNKGAFGIGKVTMRGTVANDDRADWTEAYKLFPGVVAYVWHASAHCAEVDTGLKLAGYDVRSQIIWRKQHFAMSRGHYHWQHEPCYYAVKTGQTSKWCGDRSQSTIWDINNINPSGATGKREHKVGHGTQKPVECMERPIRNHGGIEDAVYEPFSGSGTTLIAAERQQRACFAMELTPAYVQMAIDRWEAYTGQQAVKLGEAVGV